MKGYMIKIGLTGSIGCGKTTLCDFWESLGVTVVNADELGHESLEKDGGNYETVSKAFPQALDENGSINRKKLGSIVFADQLRLIALNTICLDVIRNMWQKEMAHYAMIGRKVVVVEVPLLFEANVQGDFDYTVVLGCSPETQVLRLQKRNDMTSEEAYRRIACMWSVQKKMQCADYVIWNDRDVTTLRHQAAAVLQHICDGQPDRPV